MFGVCVCVSVCQGLLGSGIVMYLVIMSGATVQCNAPVYYGWDPKLSIPLGHLQWGVLGVVQLQT